MRRIRGFALLVLLIGAGVALQSQDSAPRFEPVKIISTAEAVYPATAMNPGTVVLNVTVSATGEIEKVDVVQAKPPFTEEALRTVRKWRFAPAKVNGEPVRSTVAVAFSFSQPTLWWPQTNPPASGANAGSAP